MVDMLLVSLMDAIKSQNDLQTGNADLEYANISSARFVKSMYELIDQRINTNIEERRRLRSQEKASIKSLTALNSAPPALEETDVPTIKADSPEETDLDDADYVREWFAQYKHWYDTKRKAAIVTG